MTVTNNAASSTSIFFIGSNSLFSFTALKTLCEHNINIDQIILAAHAPAATPSHTLPVTIEQPNDSMQQLAAKHNILTHYLGLQENRHRQWQQLCGDAGHQLRPDYIFVACFPEKIPDTVIQCAKKKCVNLHPSLLPKYRGPTPLFWQLRNDEKQTGFSLHEVIDKLDAGPILHQQAINFPVNATNDELNSMLATHGAKRFIQLLSGDIFQETQQDETQASYQAAPLAEDYRIQPHWPVEHAFRFICGTQTPAGGYPITVDGMTLYLTKALSFDNNAAFSKGIQKENGTVKIRFATGVLQAKYV